MLLPVMPTTVFLILALACFTRSSDKLAAWLLNHPKFGNTLVNWQTKRVVPIKAKYFASFGMLISLIIIALTSKSIWLVSFCLLLFLLVINYLCSKPSQVNETSSKPYFKVIQGVLFAMLCHFLIAWLVFFQFKGRAQPIQVQQPNVIAVELIAAQAPKPEVSEAKKLADQAALSQVAVTQNTSSAKPVKKQKILTKKQPDEVNVEQVKPANKMQPEVRPQIKKQQRAPRAIEQPKHQAIATTTAQQHSVSKQLVSQGKQSWTASLLSHLMAYRKYPTSAIMKKQQGVVYVEVVLARDGKVIALDIVKGSGVSVLDKAALKTVADAAPLPKVPKDLTAPHKLLLPIEFFIKK
ncbi:TonB family protein [Pseudoalteromonas sp. ZZD1]|uniref:TonB family protein n=1 Tax=Pseudoalteromonas sp. ZZD1 TaxID=3139395 RepID=UPI003BAC08D7